MSSGGSNLYYAQIATFRAVFAKVFVFEGRWSGSCVIVAADKPAVDPAGLKKQAALLGGKLGRINLAAEVEKCTSTPQVKPAPVLTDDYNPANLLLMQKN